jgi:hypothetical protein
MATSVTLNGTTYSVPETGDDSWGDDLSAYLVALSTGVLQKAGGAFTLTADADFGANFGLKSTYFKSRGTVSSAGVLRLANNESIGWRNAANSADKLLKVNASNILEFDGNPLVTLALGTANYALKMNSGGTAYEWGAIANANIDSAAAIAYSKLNLATSIVNADINASAAIAYSKLNLATSIVNSDVSAAAAIALSKLAAVTASRALQSTAGGVIEASSVTSTELGYVSGVTSALQTQLDAKAPSVSPSFTTPALGTPASGVLTSCTGLPLTTGVTGTLPVANGGTGVTSSTGSGSVVLSAAPVITGGATVRGDLLLQNTSGAQPTLQLSEDPDNGTAKVTIKAPADLSGGDYTLTLPGDDGDANQVLSTNGSGTLTWASVATAPATVGAVYSDGAGLQSTAFASNGNEILGVNSGATGQEFKALSVGTSGTDFAIAHSAGAIAFNLPDASTTARGVVTTSSQSFNGLKTFTNGITAPTSTAGNVYSGTYTPNNSAISNNEVEPTDIECQYYRVGNVVTVSGTTVINPSATSTGTIIQIPTPVATTFASTGQAAGGAWGDTTGSVVQVGRIYGVAATSNVRLEFISSADVAARTWHFHFTYLVV